MKSRCKVPINTFNFASFENVWKMFYKPLIHEAYELPMVHCYRYYWRKGETTVPARIFNDDNKIIVTIYNIYKLRRR